MNEKIAELAEQSGAINDADYWGDEYFVLKGAENIEKFAELIVTKCISVVYGSNYNKADALAEEIYHKFWD